MSNQTKIEWTDATWNPIRGCSRVSEGCRNCYAARIAARFSKEGQPFHGFAEMRDGKPHWTGHVGIVEDALDAPLRWRKPRRVFVNSMSDLFHDGVSDEWLDRIWDIMRAAQKHTFQILTKRPKRMRDYLLKRCSIEKDLGERHRAVLPNVWLGVSVEDQVTADKRIPLLLQTPAALRFISAEPLLGGIKLGEFLRNLDLVICGGESGPNARPMHPDWVKSLRDECKYKNVPFFFKQWGEWIDGICVGKKAAGNLLDGKVYNEFPTYEVTK